MYAKLALFSEWDLHVIFACSFGARPSFDKKFQRVVEWSNLGLHRFSHEFLVDVTSSKNAVWDLSAPLLEERLLNFGPDVIVVYGYSQKLQRRALYWARQHGKKTLMISDAEANTTRTLIVRKIKNIVVPRILKAVNGFLTVGDSNESYYCQYGASCSDFFRSPFPIDLELYERAWLHRKELHRQLRKKLEIEDNKLVISMVGKLTPTKRQKDLIFAVEQSSLNDRSTVVLLIGSGETENELRTLSGKSQKQEIRCIGFIEPSELPMYYAATDIYIHTSSKDRHPLAISEAIYMGCPVIVSDAVGSVGPTDDVRPGCNGLVYSVGEINELAHAIGRLDIDKNLRVFFGQNSHEIGVANQVLANGLGLKHALTSWGQL